ncbi:MAG TPA: hypothetical protein VGO59_14420 [Verrucomicrobiae bacterium]
MRSDSLLKHLAICAVISLVFYVTVFAWIEHRRTFKGPWVADFRADAAGAPSIIIRQTNMAVSETLVFPGQTAKTRNATNTIIFDGTPPDLPFGELLYQDPTFLPGTVTLRVFGHQVEFFPRAFTVDKKERPWQPGGVIEVR